jgi:hypothetical protein
MCGYNGGELMRWAVFAASSRHIQKPFIRSPIYSISSSRASVFNHRSLKPLGHERHGGRV